jgi:hypothetical protein
MTARTGRRRCTGYVGTQCGTERSSVGLRLKVGERVLDRTSAGEFIVIRAPDADVELTLGGEAPLFESSDQLMRRSPDPAVASALVGKRYSTGDGSIELLCVRQGINLPAVGGCPLEMIEPKPLPASD